MNNNIQTKKGSMKTKDILKNADKVTIVNVYEDGTYLVDVLYKGKVYVIRQTLENINIRLSVTN